MTLAELLEVLRKTPGVSVGTPMQPAALHGLPEGIFLPAEHVELLRSTNGLMAYGGYFRVFGCAAGAEIDMIRWNASDVWKFAWGQDLDQFWLIGETAWGDQYAYLRSELASLGAPSVYFLEALTLRYEIIAPNFRSFLEEEFLRNAIDPYDSNLAEARKTLGDLESSQHVNYVPSPLISGVEDPETLQVIDAVCSMIIGGDLCRQVVHQPKGSSVRKLEVVEDAEGRPRLRVIWD